MRMYTDPKGTAYEQVIDLAIQNSEYFVLGEKTPIEATHSRSYTSVLEALKPYLVNTIVIEGDNIEDVVQIKKSYRSHAFYTFGTYYFYRCCEESGTLLKSMANKLSDWNYPSLPEDLCFLKQGGGDYLYSVVHERIYGIDVTEEEAIELMSRIPGLFIQIEAHRDFDRLLDDAIKHQTDWLYISRHGLKELPERIRELTELTFLEVFEQDLYRLPEGLFELSKLEHLSIMTADLESIHSSIGKLKNLKALNIQCGSSDRPAPGFRAKPKEEIGLNRIPPEIGELERLEMLTVQYTSIRELPAELVKLKNLRALNIDNCMIDRKPEFLQEMKQLEYVHVSKDSLWVTFEPE
ncbi:leucine-rich repeat domain-containing protein [Paenibacillus kobensis]|uniref:leucine-rich repeat domain-containing protein n=1 Tax=Paenibacillus kobensis TaxID=59841 RepID=UPI000FD799A7|nr:leucine-rich repeat domain-containing protein [Paenibacillus kobensis]